MYTGGGRGIARKQALFLLFLSAFCFGPFKVSYSSKSRRWRIAHRHAYFAFLLHDFRGWPLKTPEAAFIVNGVLLSAVMINNKIAFFSWKPLAHSLPLQVPNLPETRLRGIIVNNSRSGCRGKSYFFIFFVKGAYNYSRPNFSYVCVCILITFFFVYGLFFICSIEIDCWLTDTRSISLF